MWEIKLCGVTTVTTPDGRVVSGELGGVKPRQILEILALSPGTPVPKEHLADLLWEGHPPPSYLGTLESYVCVLRKSLGLGRGRGSLLATVNRGYVLHPGEVRVDLARFRDVLRAAEASTGPGADLRQIDRAVALVGGELLADETYATWAIRERERFQRELVTLASLGAERALAQDQHELAVRLARTAVGSDVLAEGAWRMLMRSSYAAGRPAEALRAFSELRHHLAVELGADPCAETTDLYLEILRAGDGTHPGETTDGREEVRILMGLLRQAVASIPGLEQPRGFRSLVQVAADLVA